MKNLKIYEAFGDMQGNTPKITPQQITDNGLKKVITQNFILDAWFNAYFKFHYQDTEYDFRLDDDFWNHTDEILGIEDVWGDESDLLQDEYWAKVLNYILDNKPNPFEDEALDTTITNALK